jgi:hypothetical protein
MEKVVSLRSVPFIYGVIMFAVRDEELRAVRTHFVIRDLPVSPGVLHAIDKLYVASRLLHTFKELLDELAVVVYAGAKVMLLFETAKSDTHKLAACFIDG